MRAVVAVVPVALAWWGFRVPFGLSFTRADIRIADDTFFTLFTNAMVHSVLACAIVLVVLPFGLIRPGGAEVSPAASNGDGS